MIRTLYLTARFQKSLARLEAASNQAASVAHKARRLVEDLAACGDTLLTHRSDVTRYQENRLENGIKFDLGGGYRLLAVREGDNLFLVYVGYHDESDRWVKNNRRRRCWEWHDLDSLEIPASCRAETDDDEELVSETLPFPDTADDHLPPIDDNMLRKVFAGLCSGQRNTSTNGGLTRAAGATLHGAEIS